jgi:hypothetical protein
MHNLMQFYATSRAGSARRAARAALDGSASAIASSWNGSATLEELDRSTTSPTTSWATPSARSATARRCRCSAFLKNVRVGLSGIAAMGLLVRAGLAAAEANPGAGTEPPLPPNDFGTIDTLGRLLFTQGLVPFELSSALLMVAIIGAVAVARGKQPAPAVDTKVSAKAKTKEIAS